MLKIAKNLWTIEQPLKFLGLEVGTPMTVIRLANNSLVLISPMEIEPQLQQQLDDLGRVKYLTVRSLILMPSNSLQTATSGYSSQLLQI